MKKFAKFKIIIIREIVYLLIWSLMTLPLMILNILTDNIFNSWAQIVISFIMTKLFEVKVTRVYGKLNIIVDLRLQLNLFTHLLNQKH